MSTDWPSKSEHIRGRPLVHISEDRLRLAEHVHPPFICQVRGYLTDVFYLVGQCENWDGSERPINLFFGVQNTVPLHAKNKRSDFGYLMQFVADLITSIDTRGNKGIFKIF